MSTQERLLNREKMGEARKKGSTFLEDKVLNVLLVSPVKYYLTLSSHFLTPSVWTRIR